MTTQQTRTRLQLGDREFIIVGTAHVSSESVNEVREAIEAEEPDHICVEIDPNRLRAMEQEASWQNLNIGTVIRQKRVFFLLASLTLQSFQKKIGSDMGVKPGEEMKAAVDLARAKDIPFSCADRDIQITLKRAWSQSSLWGKAKLMAVLLESLFASDKVSSEEIEELKQKALMDNLMEELAKSLPTIKEVIIDERDYYLAHNIWFAPGKKVLAVVGAGHVPGLIKIVESLHRQSEDAETKNGYSEKAQERIAQVTHLKKPGFWSKVGPWILPLALMVLFTVGFVTGDGGVSNLLLWAAITAGAATIGGILSLAHPLTILAGAVTAPITTIHPTLGVGFVTGLVQYWARKPRVKDMEAMQSDFGSFKGWYKNRLIHILLTFVLTSLTTSIGTFIALSTVVARS